MFLIWVIAGLLSLFGALTYAELAAAMPEAGGEYVYLSAGYGPFWGFLYGWTQFWVAKSGSIATLAASFYTYLVVFLPVLDNPIIRTNWPIGPHGSLFEIRYGQLVGIGVIAFLAALNYLGVKVGGEVQIAVTILKMVLIGAVICVGLFSGQGHWNHLVGHMSSSAGIPGLFAALVSALWAYDGWNNLSMASSEIVEPQRNLPRALILGTLVVIATYLLINVAYFYVLSPEQVGMSQRVAADMMSSLYGSWAAKGITLAVLISVFAALNGSILTGSRVPYAMARDGLFFRSIAAVHPLYRTPGTSILALSGWSCVVVLSGWYDDLYNFVIFGSWILYLLTGVSVFVLRWRMPKMTRPYRVIGYPVVPVLFVVVAFALLVQTFISRPRESLMGLVLMGAGVPFYFYWKVSRRA
jgi:APA family basic amino acid/polyamine antiporter